MTSRSLLHTPDHNSKVRVFFLSLTISVSVLLLLALIFLLLYLYFSHFDRSRTIPFDATTPLKLTRFSYKELKSATSSFGPGNAIGKGGSGSVFRGILQDGKSVAVKKLDLSCSQLDREFQNEIQILGGLRSPFIVSLLGYCIEKKKRFLVYEYMPNRSLQEALFGDGPSSTNLGWSERFEIILDVARGLQFLHLECDPPVIHGDMKPSNVLLGSEYRAKISDFGLSRVKLEGEFGVDFFSQELGRSRELWKSQELSGNLAPASETNEVDFTLAIQASSSCKNSRLDFNTKSTNSNCLNCGDADYSHYNPKGKEVTVDFSGEDLGKFINYDDDSYSADHSKELNLNPSSSPGDDVIANSKQWGKDWWWRQDGSGELCSKDYVMEWIGSQICPSANPDWDEDSKTDKTEHSTKPVLDNSKVKPGGLEDPRSRDGPSGQSKRRDAKDRGCGKSNKKMKEWWKEEYFAEISKKGHKLRKLEGKWKDSYKTMHFGLGRRFQLRKTGQRDKVNEENDRGADFSFRKGWKKKKNRSRNSEMWSGDLFSRELSSTTSMRGTICYVAPEYGGCGYLMEKADIYSFGVLILVTVSGRRPLHVLTSPMKLEKANLISWCRQLAYNGNILEMVDERLKDQFDKDQASLCINLALMCLQKMPELRPDIGDIVKILRGEMDLPSLPLEYFSSPPSKLFSKSRRRPATDAEK
ncbi:putative receptor-like protein kinase At1g80870 [Aristolochia californica]|uniref:putative receptor-like protein kinase At1g80870 n=1 Tax=Aristolochia californica TaxID=171875 RepID=UPI0035DF145D